MAFAGLDQLVRFASTKDPERDIPRDVLLSSEGRTITIFDLFPKAKYHFLVLPRAPKSSSHNFPLFPAHASHTPSYLPASTLASLSSLLSHASTDPPAVLAVLDDLGKAAGECIETIKDEMMKVDGWCWDVQIGFHAVPSMRHLHLHIISTDLISPSLKTKRHYNSFHPSLGFFIPLDEVMELVKGGATSLPQSRDQYESLLRTDLACHICKQPFKTMPALKAHIATEWEHGKAEWLRRGSTNTDKRR